MACSHRPGCDRGGRSGGNNPHHGRQAENRTIDANIDANIDIGELPQLATRLASEQLPAGWEWVPSSTHTRVARSEAQQLHCKLFLSRGPAEPLKAMLRGSRAARAAANADALLLAGFDAPRNLCRGRLPDGVHYLFMATAPGQALDGWLRERGRDNTRSALLRALGRSIGRLHASGFIHGDLRPGNILVAEPDDGFRFTLLDNERNRRQQPPPGRKLLRNLMQLNMLPETQLSRAERLRFFRSWHAQLTDLNRAEAVTLATEAHRWALRRMQAQTIRRKKP